MSKITIKRRKEWSNRSRTIGIYIDGVKTGTLKNGEIKEFEIEEGKHQVKAKVDWCGSEEIEINTANDSKGHIEVSGFKYGDWVYGLLSFFLLIYFFPKAFLSEQDFAFEWGYIFILIIPLTLYMLYFLSFGRKQYLQIKLKE